MQVQQVAADEFCEIRPFNDAEIGAVLKRFTANSCLMRGIRKEVYAGWPPPFAPVLDLLVSRHFRRRCNSVRTVDEFQRKITVDIILEWIVKNTMDTLSFSGLENLDKTQSYLFISNHRDIVLDSALLNYLLAKNGFPIFAIAFGENLTANALVSDLIRANKSFLVKRNLAFRQRIQAAYQLSRYIWFLHGQRESVWIAQREGRAKDGDDRTSPSLIKMLYLSQRKGGLTFKEFIKELHIVPVAVSYERDPCDILKAMEMQEKADNPDYRKKPEDDIRSIYLGLRGDKGRVHFALGQPLRDQFEDERNVAEAIDRTIHRAYKLWPSNYAAYDALMGSNEYDSAYSSADRERFLNRFCKEAPELRRRVLGMYAKPVMNKRALVG